MSGTARPHEPHLEPHLEAQVESQVESQVDPRRVIDLWVYRTLTIFPFVNLVVTLRNTPAKAWMYPPGVGAVGCAVIVAAMAWCLWDCARPQIRHWTGLRLLVGITSVMLWAHVWWFYAGGGPSLTSRDYPPLLHAMGGAANAASAAFGLRRGIALNVAYGVGYYLMRVKSIGPALGLGEASLQLVSLLTATMLVHLVYRAQSEVSLVARRLGEENDREAAVAAAVYERTRWDSVVHDQILGSLRLVGLSPRHDDAAARLAGSALDALSGTARGEVEPLPTTLAKLARALDLDATVDVVVGTPTPEVGEAVLAAAGEAITNVARHAAASGVTVSGTIGAESARVVIRDDGHGFAAAAVPAGTGISRGIVARMESVGGRGWVDSTPGGGTTVTLTWTRPDLDRRPLQWPMTVFVPLLLFSGAIAVLNVVLGVTRRIGLDRSVTVMLIGAVAVAAVNVASVAVDPRRRWSWLVPAAQIAVPLAMTFNIGDYTSSDWRYWFVGGLSTAGFAISLRWGLRTGTLTVAGMVLGVVGAEALAGQASLVPVLGPFPVTLGMAVNGGLVGFGLNRATARVERSLAETARAKAKQARAAMADEELNRRRAGLHRHVVPMLERIRDRTLTDLDRRECLVLEAATRDQLVAPTLLDQSVIAAVDTARRGGSHVVLTEHRVFEGDAVTAFREVLANVVAWTPAGWRVKASVEGQEEMPARAGHAASGVDDRFGVGSIATHLGESIAGALSGTIALVGAVRAGQIEDLARVVAGAAALWAKRGWEVTVTGDEDSILVEVDPH